MWPNYATLSFWFNWAVFVAVAVYLLATLRPVDWTAVRQSLGMAVFFLAFGLGLGALLNDGDLLTMLLLKNGKMEEVCVAGGYAFLLYGIVAIPVVLVRQAIHSRKHRRVNESEPV